MEEEQKVPEQPIVRTALPEDVVAFLNTTYPLRKNKGGVEQRDGVDYITSEHDFLDRKKIKILFKEQNGRDAFALYWILRHYMAEDVGWALDITDDKSEYIFMTINYFCKFSIEEIEQSISLLEKIGLIIRVDGSDGHTYLTTLQQLYNYEFKNYTRLKNNEAQRKRRRKKKVQEDPEKYEKSNNQVKTDDSTLNFNNIPCCIDDDEPPFPSDEECNEITSWFKDNEDWNDLQYLSEMNGA